MKLQIFVLDNQRIEVRPAPVERSWMDATPERFAYRCLPLNIANAHGWELLCSAGFTATWDGGRGVDSIAVVPDEPNKSPAVSHFGSGVLTFHVPCLVRTDPGYDLMVQGPVNSPKDAIAALSGIIETDWAPYSFTMNWIFTRPNITVRFDPGDPFCHFFPIARGSLEEVKPELHVLSEAQELKEQHAEWQFRRSFFNVELKQPGSQAQSEKWQKLYYRGLNPDGSRSDINDHRTRLRLRPFAKSLAYARQRNSP
jgi:hypothetical protein